MKGVLKLSRIDHIFSAGLVTRIVNSVSNRPNMWSDHSWVEVVLDRVGTRNGGGT